MLRAIAVFAVVWVDLILIPNACAQKVAVQIKNKLDEERAFIEVTVNVDGVNSRGDLTRIVSGTTKTDAEGRFSFTIPVKRLDDLASVLQNSKEVSISLIPSDSNLSAVVIGGLLGTADQTFAVVMKERSVPVRKEIRESYPSGPCDCYNSRPVHIRGCGNCCQ
jgi:hypothetical protein